MPVFDERLLQTLRWAAHHYVAPLAGLLRRAAPPNLPRKAKRAPGRIEVSGGGAGPSGELGRAIASGRVRNSYLEAADANDLIGLVAPILANGASVMVVAPTAIEATRLTGRMGEAFGDAMLGIVPETTDRDATSVWSRAASQPGYVLIGTPKVSLWPVAGLRAAVVVGEARRGLKDRQTPTVHSRDLLRARSRVERFALVLTGLVPSTESVATGTEVIPAKAGRPWSLIEFVDRGDDPPGSSFLSDRAKAAVASSVKRGEAVFVFTHRRGYAPAFRCVRCRELRVCSRCGARAARVSDCRRCGAEQGPCHSCRGDRFEPLGAGVERVAELVRRFVDADKVGYAGEGRQVTVGSVRDLPSLGPCGFAVVVDADGLVLGTDYRAGEEALRTLARVAAVVGPGSGRRTLIQTANPDHPVLEALRRGESSSFLDAELRQRAVYGFPPVGDLIALECRSCPSGADAKLKERLGNVDVLGPAPTEHGMRWLLQASDLTSARGNLRKLAGEWRDAGARLRIDVDPIDL
jgi:primosomal protein N' (replication factor Y)